MLDAKGDLAAVEVAFFGPAFLIGLFVVFRHGFSKQVGYIYIIVLSILRIVGASATLDMEVTNKYSDSLLTTAAICSAVGTAPLLLAMMGFLERINKGMEHKGISLMIFRPLHLISLAALIIAIIGGTDKMSASAGNQKTGKDLGKAGAMLFFGILLALTIITLFNVTNTRYVLSHEKNLLRACVIALPFLAVRIAYTIASAFSKKGGLFYYADVNIYVQAFMQFAMEAIVVCIFITAGVLTPKMEKQKIIEGDVEGQKVEMISGPTQRSGRTEQQTRQDRPRFQAPQNIGDYRPSRLIKNAMSSRK
ncbi:hypothetical protein LTR27_000253 [Elasticomyces elasticus]|nr:hypothetical protein LTR27_000253 [Elasticomyces elasticus]